MPGVFSSLYVCVIHACLVFPRDWKVSDHLKLKLWMEMSYHVGAEN